MWIPSWLGHVYSNLFDEFEKETFTFSQAAESLGFGTNKLAVAFSKLHSVRLLTVFERGRPRTYRIVDPTIFTFLACDTAQDVKKIRQERYLPLLLSSLKAALKRFSVQSFAVYGSVARGRATQTSDVDIIILSSDFQGSIGSRIELLMTIEDSSQEELSWLRRHGIHTGLGFHPLRNDEAKRLPNLFLDLTEDAAILYDSDRFLEELLTELKAKLIAQGASRVFLDRDRWYWDLKPRQRPGETVAAP